MREEQYVVYSDQYPPRNRKPTGLDVLDIELLDRLGTLRVDPNRAAVIGYTGALPLLEPVAESCLSGAPGYVYRTREVELCLTRDELLRLRRRSLAPREVLKLLELYGSFHEIHQDFYDEETGEAFQPMQSRTR